MVIIVTIVTIITIVGIVTIVTIVTKKTKTIMMMITATVVVAEVFSATLQIGTSVR
jgi:uncharacterized RDD family membrane protein YckC